MIYEIERRYLPRECYSANKMDAYEGIVIHFTSGRWVLPDDRFNLEVVYWMTRDLNFTEPNRYSRLVDPISQSWKRDYSSYHWLIGREGETLELVNPIYQAYHAGVSRFREKKSCNGFMLGIGLVNDGLTKYTKPQYDRTAALCADLSNKHGFTANEIVGHSDVAPDRKHDPGPDWDWDRFRRLHSAMSKL